MYSGTLFSSSPTATIESISHLSRLLDSLLHDALGRPGGGLNGVNSLVLDLLGGFES